MLYCPNCSAYQYDSDATVCRKCGYDMASHQEEERRRTEAEKSEDRENGADLSQYDRELPCLLCGSPSRLIDTELEVQHEGSRIEIKGLKLMGGDITKKTMVLYRIPLKGVECSEGHKFFIETGRSRRKALCPMCLEPMAEYGTSLYSCTKCDRHFPMEEWEMPSDSEVLEENGWLEAD